ncbi:TonB-dependent receptor plug domain-containing protein [Phenylobacterium sp. 58.2.17]|uniref:TonB-dependent receptor plug domain-containing protein n=1 Tax=Phenylobacterium sp. 58.2.17 TaxID=2969306 RepID=UPI00226408EA|nr:TonB-dependent receptor [Phenylobacterium sp. 58.2.17]MCX7587260.1 TonB-dependent receptor [Phenylobacterium sp. 58.2.17]
MATTGVCRHRARLLASSAVIIGVLGAAGQAAAQDEPTAQVEEVVVTGSRFGPRVVTDSPTPIDSISSEELRKGGGNDLQSLIKVAVPSFSTPRPAAAGAQDFLAPPTMRGLSTGQVLVLVNGKRRHTSADLNISNQIGRGDVAYDFNAIPTAAISRLEVLRDGAAAQYGADAIAGVINIMLDNTVGYSMTGKVGQTSRGDGDHMELALGAGFAIGDGGVVRITGQYQDHKRTDRAKPDTRQQYFGIAPGGGLVMPSGSYGSGTGLTPSNGALDPREATFDRNVWVFGEPDYTNASLFVNAELPLSATATAYAFGGYNRLEGTSYNFFRRAGQDETVRAIHPNGFLPLQEHVIENFSSAAGVRGDDLLGFKWDLSTLYGQSRSKGSYTRSNNVSYGAASQTDFYRGGVKFEQWTTNFDLSREIALGLASPLKVALGLEYRKEWYEKTAGEPASYLSGGVPILDGPNAGKPAPVGSQPAPGATPDESGTFDRDSKAIYGEIEQAFFDERLTLSAALRYENFSDFGATTNYKVAGRFQIVEGLALRGSVGSGFRAPALPQSYFSNSSISFINGAPLSVRVVSVNDPIAPLIGAKPLDPETSNNLSVGGVFELGRLTATVDFYRIEIQDRIVISSNFSSPALTSLLAANGFPGINAVAYVTNAVDSTTQGVDITARYRQDLGDYGSLTATVAANFNKTEFDKIAGTPAPLAALGITAPLFDLTQQVRTKDATPKDKIMLNLAWERGPLSINLTNTRYGEVSQVALTNRTPAQVAALIPGYDVTLVPVSSTSANSDIIQHFGADIVTDLEASYRVTDEFTMTAGVSNLFDKMPDKLIASTAATVAAGTNGADNNGIFPYAYIAPYGTNGRFFYVKAAYRF